jgi:hypothetical protein
MSTAAPRRAERWFWGLTTVAVCAAGALYDGLRAAPGPGTGLRVLISGLMLAASAVQAARILAVLIGQPRPSTVASRLGRHLRKKAVPHSPDGGPRHHGPARTPSDH